MKWQVAGVLCALISTVEIASAQNIWDTSVSSCSTVNCSSLEIGGTLMSLPNLSALPWTTSVYARSGECLRLDVTWQQNDLETVVRSPNGTIYREDDTSGTRPIVSFVVSQTGWYSVSIAHWSGSAVNADFILKYGRYNGSNMNCARRSTPRMNSFDTVKPQMEAVPANPIGPMGR
jgi:hypothetical protein